MIYELSQNVLKFYPAVVIPAYQPDEQLFVLIQELRKRHADQLIIVVNDGSDALTHSLFQRLQNFKVHVIHHEKNLGKGQALKTAFAYYLEVVGLDAIGVISADADGQHSAEDIFILSNALAAAPERLYLGVRDFSSPAAKKADIPWRSKIGNLFTGYIFRKLSATPLYDTQTGLRGIPMHLLKTLLNSRLNGYELEMEMLLIATLQRIPIHQIPIKIVYYNRNACSHFSPLRDSCKILRVLAHFLLNRIARSHE